MLKAVTLARKDFPKVDLLVEDEGCDARMAVSAAQKLLAENVKVFLAGCVASVKAVAPVLRRKGGVVFVIGGIDDETLQKNDNVVDLAAGVKTETRSLAAYLKRDSSVRNISMIHGTNFFGEELESGLRQGLESSTITLDTVEKIAVDANECRSVALRIARKKSHVVFVHASEATSGICVKALRTLGYSGTIYAPYTTESQSFLDAAGLAAEGVRYTYSSNSASEEPAKLEWESRYQAEFNRPPIAHGLIVYDGIHWLESASHSCPANDARCLAEHFKHLGEAHGLSGKIRFGKDGSATRPFGIKEIRSGKFQWVTQSINGADST